MKSWKLWAGVVILLLLVARLVYRSASSANKRADEREWYARQLHYDLSLRIDTVILFNTSQNGIGKISGTLTRGHLEDEREDSLGQHLQHHSRLRFNTSNQVGKVTFSAPIASKCKPGDSVTIDSNANQVAVYRNKEHVRKIKLSSSLTGRPITKKK